MERLTLKFLMKSTGCISKIKCIEIAPFLGTSGGILKYYDKDADDFVKDLESERTYTWLCFRFQTEAEA